MEAGAGTCLRRGTHLGRLGLVDGPASSRRDGGDRIGDGGRPVWDGRCEPGSRSWPEQPDSDEAAYLLGICEQARGRNQAAAEAWARVAPGSAFAHQAILARMRLFHDSGRLAAAEQLINDAAEDPRNDRSDLRVLLVPIFSQLGRVDEAERLIEARWEHLNETGEGASERAIELVRMHIELTLKASPVEDVRDYLDQAAALAPDDDRVWLGRANLAIRTGALRRGQAVARLPACCAVRRMSRSGAPG